MGPSETCNSGSNRVVLHAQNEWCDLGSIETSNYDTRHTVFHAQNDR